MGPETFGALPPLCDDLAKGAVKAMLTTLGLRPDSPMRRYCLGNWTTDKRELIQIEDISAVALQESANDAHLLATSMDADYVMTMLDMPGPPRAVTIGIEMHSGTYVGTFPVVRMLASGPAMTLGPGQFRQSEHLPEPFDRLLRPRAPM